MWGLGNLLHKQIARFVAFIALEIGYLTYMITFGVKAIGDFFTLGSVLQEEVWDEALGIYTYTKGDNSMLCLLYGVITILLTLVAIFVAFTTLLPKFFIAPENFGKVLTIKFHFSKMMFVLSEKKTYMWHSFLYHL